MSVPEICAGGETDSYGVERRPVDEIKVEVIDESGCLQNFDRDIFDVSFGRFEGLKLISEFHS